MTELKGKVVNVDINDQMKSAYIDIFNVSNRFTCLTRRQRWAKTVHRRVLFGCVN
jgi:hypothetical protein